VDSGDTKRRRRKPITPDRVVPAMTSGEAVSIRATHFVTSGEAVPIRASEGVRQLRGDDPQRRQRATPSPLGVIAKKEKVSQKPGPKKGSAQKKKVVRTKTGRKSDEVEENSEDGIPERISVPRPSMTAHKFTAGKRPDLIGNRYWARRKENKGGSPRKFNSPEELAEAIDGYFEWMEANPLHELKSWQNMGTPVGLEVPKMRAMGVASLCLHIGISRKSLINYEARSDEYAEIIQAARDTIFAQKFEGAAADMLNSNVIIRDLGLKERTDVTSGDDSVDTIVRKVIDVSDKRERRRKGG